ncbi:hypothetical protein N665_0464s0006 [Sinapis alba]|nr:hypothetical protein N665_0464s0006 [Sinapis alba]
MTAALIEQVRILRDLLGQLHPAAKPILPRVLVETGSSVNLIFRETLQKMELFTGETTMSVGSIKLPVHVEGVTKITTFTIINKPSVYNVILVTPWLHAMEAVPSSYHEFLKFPTAVVTYALQGNQDSFPMPHIDHIVEATAGNELRSFMDALAGYNQILMHPEDREKN